MLNFGILTGTKKVKIVWITFYLSISELTSDIDKLKVARYI